MAGGDDGDEDGTRRRANIAAVVFVVLLLLAGIWVALELDKSRKAQECLESGRRNCRTIEVPPR